MASRNITSTSQVSTGQALSNLSILRWIGVVIGIGVAGTLDEVVFHQLLQWHNFYVHTTEQWRIVSDGLFHAFSSIMLCTGALLFWSQRRRIAQINDVRALSGGMMMGAGGFNLYDGTIQHKILQLHPVRENVENIVPYDIAWNLVALVLLILGWTMWRSAKQASEPTTR